MFWHALRSRSANGAFGMCRCFLTKTGILEVVKSELVKSNYYMHNGRVVNHENGKVWIKIADGFLIISEIRDCKTKEPLAIRDTFKLGERLN